MKKFQTGALCIAICWLALGSSAHAELPSWLKKQNADVNDGNEAMQKGDPKGALESYNRAAAKLPEAPGVALDRGIALLKQGDYGKAREALLSATVPNASTDVRADAYQDLSLSFYREADGLASQNNHADAQKLFREALDAAKRSLHLRPGDPNTAWNMELAARRVREEEQKQKEEDEQKKKDEQKQDGDKQNQDQDQKQDGDKSQDQKQDQGKQDQKDKPEPKKPEEQKGQDKPKPDKPESGEQQPAEPRDKEEPQDKGLPREAEQALDSLENGEENFERYRARQRASRERRAPEKDW